MITVTTSCLVIICKGLWYLLMMTGKLTIESSLSPPIIRSDANTKYLLIVCRSEDYIYYVPQSRDALGSLNQKFL